MSGLSAATGFAETSMDTPTCDLTVTRVWEQWLNDRHIAEINAAFAGRVQPKASSFPGCYRGRSAISAR